MTWQYRCAPFVDTPSEYEGFVYKISNTQTGRYYIGQKRFWRVKKLPPLKGKKNKRHSRVESDWRTYWGSSEALKLALAEDSNNWQREIVLLCATKGDLNYHETRLQFEYGVLLDPLAFNGIINCKIHRSHLSKTP